MELLRCPNCKHEWPTRKPGGAKKCPRCQHQLTEPPPESPEILRIIHRCAGENKSAAEIADMLNKAELKTRRGLPWSHQYIAGILWRNK